MVLRRDINIYLFDIQTCVERYCRRWVTANGLPAEGASALLPSEADSNREKR